MDKISQKKLEILLQKLEIFTNPKVELEQYPTDAYTAANLIYFAGFHNDDIKNKVVIDLGCGTGRLAIGAALFGAKKVIGVDIDEEAIEIARRNAIKMDLEIEWIVSDIQDLDVKVDTVIMNVPFGVKKKGVDRKFLQKAFEISTHVIYSLHKYTENNRKFLITFMHNFCKVDKIIELRMKIPHQFKFHQKKIHEIKVDLYRLLMINEE